MPSTTPTSKQPSGPPTMWTTMHSPVLPSEWPTTWMRYTFAYGHNPTELVDGAYVTQPLTRTIVQRDGSNGEATTLSTGAVFGVAVTAG